MKTKVDIISGFLGAGKTTLIKKLIEEKLHNEKLVIIENEFGEIGIDGTILKNSNIEVKEINSGCICCTLLGDFEKSIGEIIFKFKPDRILIEPSGVGKLSDVIKACDAPELKDLLTINMLVTVVDVLKYQIYIANFGEFFENQIKNANTIILSRTQKADRNKLEAIVNSIKKLNNKANIVTTPWETLNAELIIAVAEQDTSISLEHQLTDSKKVVLKKHSHLDGCKCGCKDNHHQNHNADEVFDVWGVETSRIFDKNELKGILDNMENDRQYGMILRGKGILQIDKDRWVQFDYVPGEFGIKETCADYSGRLCVIGKNLDKTELCKLFHILA